MLLNVYLCGWLVTTIGALVAVNRLSDRRTSRSLSLGSLAVLAGVLWPVLVVGVVELIAIVLVARRMRAASAPVESGAVGTGRRTDRLLTDRRLGDGEHVSARHRRGRLRGNPSRFSTMRLRSTSLEPP